MAEENPHPFHLTFAHRHDDERVCLLAPATGQWYIEGGPGSGRIRPICERDHPSVPAAPPTGHEHETRHVGEVADELAAHAFNVWTRTDEFTSDGTVLDMFRREFAPHLPRLLAARGLEEEKARLLAAIHTTAETAINSVYGTDDRHAYMGLRIAEHVVHGTPLPWKYTPPKTDDRTAKTKET